MQKHALDLMLDGKYLCVFLKIQFLESKSRRVLLTNINLNESMYTVKDSGVTKTETLKKNKQRERNVLRMVYMAQR